MLPALSKWLRMEMSVCIEQVAMFSIAEASVTATTTGTNTASNLTINSLLFTGAYALNSTPAKTLQINSGAILDAGFGATIGSGFTKLDLDNSEGVVTVTGGALTISTPIDVTQGGTHTASGALTKSGAGTLLLTATNLYTGPTTINQGTLQIGNGTTGSLAAIAGAVTINPQGALVIDLPTGKTFGQDIVANGVLTITNPGSETLSGSISGSSGITQSTPNTTLTLSGANSYTGATLVSSGTLSLTGALNGSNVTVNGASAVLNEGDAAVIGGSGSSFTLANGSATLSGANTYGGATTIYSGTLTVNGANGSIASSSAYTINGGTLSLNYTLNGGNPELNSAANVSLSLGGMFSMTTTTTDNPTELINAIAITNGNSVISLGSPASNVTTLTVEAEAYSFTRSNFATALVRGANLNQSSTTDYTQIILGDGGTSLGLVGTNTLNDGGTADNTQALEIVPYLVGGITTADNGSNFVTYDSFLGLRVLTAAEDHACRRFHHGGKPDQRGCLQWHANQQPDRQLLVIYRGQHAQWLVGKNLNHQQRRHP